MRGRPAKRRKPPFVAPDPARLAAARVGSGIQLLVEAQEALAGQEDTRLSLSGAALAKAIAKAVEVRRALLPGIETCER